MQYRIVEVPAFTCVEDTLNGDRLVSIHTTRKEGADWVLMSPSELSERKQRIIDIFNLECKLIDVMIGQGWDEVQGQIIYVNDPDSYVKYGSWMEAIIGNLSQE